MEHPRVLIVADSVSASFGGEAILPLHYFRLLRRRGVEAWMIAHSRTRDELLALLPEECGRMTFVPDTALHCMLDRASARVPRAIRDHVVRSSMGMLSQWIARRIARELVVLHGIDVIHQPAPVSPKLCSLFHDMGAPVVIGPMNGGMTYPPAFRQRESLTERSFVRLCRFGAHALHRVMPGKLRATTLLVANERTRQALPVGIQGRVAVLVENGVDLSLWHPVPRRVDPEAPVRFAFSGRLVDWKAVDVLLEAFSWLRHVPSTLDVIGDGAERPRLEQLARSLGVAHRVRFHGWLEQPQAARELATMDVLVLPSLYECGGAVVLEAMALGLPVVATAWGGPADYLDASCGILVEPASRTAFTAKLAHAMLELAIQPELRERMGRAGRTRAAQHFDWQQKIDRILEIYAEARQRGGTEVIPFPRTARTVRPAAMETERAAS